VIKPRGSAAVTMMRECKRVSNMTVYHIQKYVTMSSDTVTSQVTWVRLELTWVTECLYMSCFEVKLGYNDVDCWP